MNTRNTQGASDWDPQGLGLVPMVVEQSGRGDRVQVVVRLNTLDLQD